MLWFTIIMMMVCSFNCNEQNDILYPYTNDEGEIGFIDKYGNIVVEPQYDDFGTFSEGLAAVSDGDSWRYINNKGMIVVNLRFDVASDFSEGRAIIKRDGEWGFVDKTGNEVITASFEGVHNYHEGLAAAKISVS